MNKKSINEVILLVFAPLLILTGIAGFVLPAEKSLTSGAAPYNIFHLIFGVVGLIIALTRIGWMAEVFNLSFGLIDIYQAFASYAQLFPERLFRWTIVDDWLHIIVGIVLVLVGCYGLSHRRSSVKSGLAG